MPMQIVVLTDRDDIALVHFAEKLPPVKEQPSFNMSLDYTSVDIHRFVDTRDAFVIENGSVTVTPGLILNDYIIDDRNLNIGDISLFTQKSVDIVAENIITDEDIGYEDRDLPLGDNSIRETRSISTIIKVENRDDE